MIRVNCQSDQVVNRAEEIMKNEPQTSIPYLSQEINLSVATDYATHKLLKKECTTYPYRVIAVQLLEVDYPRRVQFRN